VSKQRWDVQPTTPIVQGVDHIVPVDMYLRGLPARPEMLLDAISTAREDKHGPIHGRPDPNRIDGDLEKPIERDTRSSKACRSTSRCATPTLRRAAGTQTNADDEGTRRTCSGARGSVTLRLRWLGHPAAAARVEPEAIRECSTTQPAPSGGVPGVQRRHRADRGASGELTLYVKREAIADVCQTCG